MGEARLHLAAAGAGEEGERLTLEVGEDVGAQSVHDARANGGRQPGLHDTEQLRDDGDGEHPAHGPEEQAHVLVGQGVVDDGAQEEGAGHRDDRDGDDDRGDDGDGLQVRAEEGEHPAHRHGRLGELLAVGGVDLVGGAAAAAASGAGGVIHGITPFVGSGAL